MSIDQSQNDKRIDYIEFPATDVAATKEFYSDVFGWSFTDYGPDYTSFKDGRIDGGFYKSDNAGSKQPLIAIYAADLAAIELKIKSAGGTIVRETYSFPGGRRFHFNDPSGNELAVWSE